MEDARKREAVVEVHDGGSTAVKKAREAAAELEEEETEEVDVMAWLVTDEIDGEFTADELRQLLEEEEESSLAMNGNDVVGVSWSEIEDYEGLYGSVRVRFIDETYTMAQPVVFQSSSGYVTINGNEESCGSSFSDSEASVMASVDARGLFGIGVYFNGNGEVETIVQGEKRGAWDSNQAEASSYGISHAVRTDGGDAFDRNKDDDDLLARFLGEESV